MKVLLVAPIEKAGLTGGQARAAGILAAGLREREDVMLFHSVQPHRQEARGIWRMVRTRLLHYAGFLNVLVRERPDVAHFFSTCSTQAIVEKAVLSLVARIFSVPTIINLRNDPVPFFRELSATSRRIVRGSLRMHEGAICQYSALRDFYIDDVGFPAGRVFIAHNAIPNSLCGYSQNITERRYKGRRIVYLGSLQRRKGLDVLFRAVALLKTGDPVWIDVLGDAQPASYLEELRACAAELGIGHWVTFHGPLFGQEKEKVLSSSTILVLPSRAEGFPNVALEAGWLGLPVILTRVGAADDIAAAFGCGALRVEVNDARGLSQALAQVLGEAKMYPSRAEAAANGASMFSVQRMCDQIVSAYASVKRGVCSDDLAKS